MPLPVTMGIKMACGIDRQAPGCPLSCGSTAAAMAREMESKTCLPLSTPTKMA